MPITTYPHCGRTFVCTDTVGITDIRQARSAYAFSLTYGQQQASAFSRAWNFVAGTVIDDDLVGTTRIFDEPLCGFTSGANFVKQSTPYATRIPIELVDSFDQCAITLGFRFASIAEAQEWGFPSGGNGEGAKGQRIRIQLTNLANAVTNDVLDIYYNKAWYNANVSTVGGANWIDLETMAASGGFQTAGLTQFDHNVITILHALPASIRQINRAAAGMLYMSYEAPRNSNGGVWTGGAFSVGIYEPKTHPLSGARMAFAGINEADIRFYRTDSWTQGTAAATATRSRAYPLTPIASWPSMGDTYTAGVHNSLNAYANSIKSIGYVAANAIGAQRGGFVRPLVGFSYQFTEQAQTMTFYGEIPEGATQFMLLAYIKMDSAGGRVQTNRVRINANGFETLASVTTTSFGTTSADWWYVTGTIAAFNSPTNGQVNRCEIIIEVEKTIYGNRNLSPIYWDGLHSLLLKFF